MVRILIATKLRDMLENHRNMEGKQLLQVFQEKLERHFEGTTPTFSGGLGDSLKINVFAVRQTESDPFSQDTSAQDLDNIVFGGFLHFTVGENEGWDSVWEIQELKTKQELGCDVVRLILCWLGLEQGVHQSMLACLDEMERCPQGQQAVKLLKTKFWKATEDRCCVLLKGEPGTGKSSFIAPLISCKKMSLGNHKYQVVRKGGALIFYLPQGGALMSKYKSVASSEIRHLQEAVTMLDGIQCLVIVDEADTILRDSDTLGKTEGGLENIDVIKGFNSFMDQKGVSPKNVAFFFLTNLLSTDKQINRRMDVICTFSRLSDPEVKEHFKGYSLYEEGSDEEKSKLFRLFRTTTIEELSKLKKVDKEVIKRFLSNNLTFGDLKNFKFFEGQRHSYQKMKVLNEAVEDKENVTVVVYWGDMVYAAVGLDGKFIWVPLDPKNMTKNEECIVSVNDLVESSNYESKLVEELRHIFEEASCSPTTRDLVVPMSLFLSQTTEQESTSNIKFDEDVVEDGKEKVKQAVDETRQGTFWLPDKRAVPSYGAQQSGKIQFAQYEANIAKERATTNVQKTRSTTVFCPGARSQFLNMVKNILCGATFVNARVMIKCDSDQSMWHTMTEFADVKLSPSKTEVANTCQWNPGAQSLQTISKTINYEWWNCSLHGWKWIQQNTKDSITTWHKDTKEEQIFRFFIDEKPFRLHTEVAFELHKSNNRHPLLGQSAFVEYAFPSDHKEWKSVAIFSQSNLCVLLWKNGDATEHPICNSFPCRQGYRPDTDRWNWEQRWGDFGESGVGHIKVGEKDIFFAAASDPELFWGEVIPGKKMRDDDIPQPRK